MILETSFSLAISAVITLIFTVWKWNALTYEKAFLLISVVIILFVSSYISSNNGIARMNSHDRKMIEALRNLQQS